MTHLNFQSHKFFPASCRSQYFCLLDELLWKNNSCMVHKLHDFIYCLHLQYKVPPVHPPSDISTPSWHNKNPSMLTDDSGWKTSPTLQMVWFKLRFRTTFIVHCISDDIGIFLQALSFEYYYWYFSRTKYVKRHFDIKTSAPSSDYSLWNWC